MKDQTYENKIKSFTVFVLTRDKAKVNHTLVGVAQSSS